MKLIFRKCLVILIAVCLPVMLTACSNQRDGEPAAEETVIVDTATEEPLSEAERNTDSGTEADAVLPDQAEAEDEPRLEVIKLNSPAYGPYLADTSGEAATPLKLTLQLESPNQITDTENWFITNDLHLNYVSEPDSFFDDAYVYMVNNMQGILDVGQAADMGCLLTVIEKNSEEAQYQFDFSDFCFESEEMRHSQTYTEMDITWAEARNDILYVSLFYNGYAKPNTSFIVAVSLQTKEVIWKSDSLVCNSYNFVIEQDVILTGYGFTSESDYLYQLDLRTGDIVAQEALKSKPDYLVWRDGLLYVRCYNTDYIFQVG